MFSVKDQYQAIASHYQLPHDVIVLMNEKEDMWVGFSLQSRLLYSKNNQVFEVRDKLESYLLYFLFQVHPKIGTYEAIEKYLLQSCRQTITIELLRKKTTAIRKSIKTVLLNQNKEGLVKTNRSQGYYIDNRYWKKMIFQHGDIPLLESIAPKYYRRITRHLKSLNQLIYETLVHLQTLDWKHYEQDVSETMSYLLSHRHYHIQWIRRQLGYFERIKAELLQSLPLKPEDVYRLQLEAKLSELKTYIGLAGCNEEFLGERRHSAFQFTDYQQLTWSLFDHIKYLLLQAFQCQDVDPISPMTKEKISEISQYTYNLSSISPLE